MKVDVTIKDLTTGAYFTLPVLAEPVSFTIGDQTADTVEVLGLGEVDFLKGKALDSFTITSFFPARYDPSYCRVRTSRTPLRWKELFENWKDRERRLQVVIAALGVNQRMTIRQFLPTIQGAEGDIHYSLTFKEHVIISPKKITVGTTKVAGKSAKKVTKAAKANVKPKTYRTKQGDTLTKIAKTYGIKNWRTGLYEPNKKVIGSNPNKLKTGLTLTIV